MKRLNYLWLWVYGGVHDCDWVFELWRLDASYVCNGIGLCDAVYFRGEQHVDCDSDGREGVQLDCDDVGRFAADAYADAFCHGVSDAVYGGRVERRGVCGDPD